MVAILIIAAAFARLIPHVGNFAPIGALALFSGAIIKNRKWSFILPIGGQFLGDAIMEIMHPGQGFYPDIVFVYASFLLITLLGMQIKDTSKPLRIASFSILGSLAFFFITNFGVWAVNASVQYSRSLQGLMDCYALAVPFFRSTLISDLLYSGIFFGVYYLATRRQLAASRA
jgi:hypothetical protein